jgi:similar to spore coat protein
MNIKHGIHETLEAHELLTFKNLSLTKSATMRGLVQDDELSKILSKDVKLGTKHIKQLKAFLLDRGEH